MNTAGDGHVIDRIIARIDGVMTASEVERFDRHLTGCASCNDEWKRHEVVLDSLEALPGDENAPPTWPGVAESIAGSDGRHPSVRATFAAAAAGLLLAFGIGSFAPDSDDLQAVDGGGESEESYTIEAATTLGDIYFSLGTNGDGST